jgi:hypothetical protein
MFDRLGSAAEKLAANVSESRRGFLVRVGEAALGVAGAFGGLLALPTEAQAALRGGYCQVGNRVGRIGILTGICVCARPCANQRDSRCPRNHLSTSIFGPFCGSFVAANWRCLCR